MLLIMDVMHYGKLLQVTFLIHFHSWDSLNYYVPIDQGQTAVPSIC